MLDHPMAEAVNLHMHYGVLRSGFVEIIGILIHEPF
jgi:hypothetical protein